MYPGVVTCFRLRVRAFAFGGVRRPGQRSPGDGRPVGLPCEGSRKNMSRSPVRIPGPGKSLATDGSFIISYVRFRLCC